MVGVPGRSKGCHTCRRRKKGCDGQRPSCGQCQKARIECHGYERQWIFVNVTSPPIIGPASGSSTARSTPEITMPSSLSRSAYEEKYLGMFWDIYLPEGTASVQTLGRYSFVTWIPIVLDLHTKDPALNKALLALCLGTIGSRRNITWMSEESLKLYAGAVSDMNLGLKNKSRRTSDALLLTTRTLGLYELICGLHDENGATITWANSWQGHNLGQMGLIMQRTPEGHVDGHAHDLFVDARMNVTNALLILRRRSALCDTTWKTVPWTKVPKNPTDVLYDIIGDIPGLLEDADRMNLLCDPVERANLLSRLVEDCWNIDTDLTWWFEGLSPREEFEALKSRGFTTPSTTGFAASLVMMKYWSACISAYGAFRQILASNSPASLFSLPERTNPQNYCRYIIELSQMFFHNASGVFGKHTMLFPLGIAYAYLLSTDVEGYTSPEMQMIQLYFQRPQCGQRVQRFMHSMLSAGPELADEILNDSQYFRARARAWLGLLPVTPPESPESDFGQMLHDNC
ncbi:hypothetical protein F5X68DRAFT_254157 [Plectosphaerella plurivora]|uniref:Zn(2)-C6 fungal-type domain-containing protein n=1 Tax=Plectosphaerella plurivora TaxID=936078 RepID=A0A9P8VDN9_9PEZI|nr:hypothetical protein F5X68DRAFT_254157 [Plectosphaerella plurivora]